MPNKWEEARHEFSEMIQASVLEGLRKELGGVDLPDGVVTVVFTDVEGSTKLVRDLGDATAMATLRRHDELVRKVLAEHDGIEVERSGDAFMLAFRLPSRAVAFALDLQARLAADGDVRVRMGMDTGEVIREEKGYFGRTVFRAARIAELAHGGQVVASEATRILAEANPQARFVDLGEKELDRLGGGHQVFEVVPLSTGT